MDERTTYRAVVVEYVADPLASRAESGRFHGPGDGSTMYAAGTRNTAWSEVRAHVPANPNAFRMLEIRSRIHRLVDLTDAATQDRLGVDPALLTDRDRRRCQALGRRLRADGVEALWTFSAADQPDGRVLVVFLDRLSQGSKIDVIGSDPIALDDEAADG